MFFSNPFDKFYEEFLSLVTHNYSQGNYSKLAHYMSRHQKIDYNQSYSLLGNKVLASTFWIDDVPLRIRTFYLLFSHGVNPDEAIEEIGGETTTAMRCLNFPDAFHPALVRYFVVNGLNKDSVAQVSRYESLLGLSMEDEDGGETLVLDFCARISNAIRLVKQSHRDGYFFNRNTSSRYLKTLLEKLLAFEAAQESAGDDQVLPAVLDCYRSLITWCSQYIPQEVPVETASSTRAHEVADVAVRAR